jgi:hypothetical protein
MAAGIAANGSLVLRTEVGPVRAQSGDIVIEQNGAVWVRTIDEAPDFMETLRSASSLGITNIGPGKARRIGTAGRIRGPRKKDRPASKMLERPPRNSPIAGTRPTIEWIHLDRLTIDTKYQRATDNEASRGLIVHIADKFDWRLCAPLVVSRRSDDTLVIIDGQHRWLAARRRSDIPDLPCCVFRYENMQEEARMFILANRSRRPINRLDDYYAAVAAEDEDSLEIQQLVTDAGLKVTRKACPGGPPAGEIAFTGSIANAIRKVGPAVASAALTDMAIAFRDQKIDHGSAIFRALVLILAAPEPGFDPDLLLSVLQTRTVAQWGTLVTRLEGGDTRAVVLQKAFMEAYREQVLVTAA